MEFCYHYQLILQLPAENSLDYQTLLELETRIIRCLGDSGEVEGHDMGKGEMNIFIHTDQPREAFERIVAYIGTRDFLPEMKVAFRRAGCEDYTVIYPLGLGCFNVA